MTLLPQELAQSSTLVDNGTREYPVMSQDAE